MPHEAPRPPPGGNPNEPRQGYRKILAATDFSAAADAAVRQAVWAAEQFQSHLVLAHVLADFRKALYAASEAARREAFYGDPDVFQREIRVESDKRLQSVISALGPASAGIRYETLVGEPFVQIIHAVQAEGYDLVVTGTRGLSPWKQFAFGSTAKSLDSHVSRVGLGRQGRVEPAAAVDPRRHGFFGRQPPCFGTGDLAGRQGESRTAPLARDRSRCGSVGARNALQPIVSSIFRGGRQAAARRVAQSVAANVPIQQHLAWAPPGWKSSSRPRSYKPTCSLWAPSDVAESRACSWATRPTESSPCATAIS